LLKLCNRLKVSYPHTCFIKNIFLFYLLRLFLHWWRYLLNMLRHGCTASPSLPFSSQPHNRDIILIIL
jgi:hypothetical protein